MWEWPGHSTGLIIATNKEGRGWLSSFFLFLFLQGKGKEVDIVIIAFSIFLTGIWEGKGKMINDK